MNHYLFSAIVAIAAILLVAIPAVYGESNSKRFNDGVTDGTAAANIAVSFNPACDPSGAHTSDGQHSTQYCTGWSQGYTSTWNSLHPSDIQQTTQTQHQTQTQTQRSNTCIALSCKFSQSGSQGENQGVTGGGN
jgi:hypothetical protein